MDATTHMGIYADLTIKIMEVTNMAMTVTEALYRGYSCRDFRSDPIEKQVLLDVFKAAFRTPSWENTQPWDVYVAGGDSVKRIHEAFLQNESNGVSPHVDIGRPKGWTDAISKRVHALYPKLEKYYENGLKDFSRLNKKFFNAPAVIYLCMDQKLGEWSIFDIGAFSQSIMLAATEHGLATMPAVTLNKYPDAIRKELDIPDNLLIVFGIAIGYENKSNTINQFRSDRKSIEEVSLKGF